VISVSKTFLALGVVFLAVGLPARISPRLPFLGRLPGDILIQRENFTFYFPLATCLAASLMLTVLAALFNHFMRPRP